MAEDDADDDPGADPPGTSDRPRGFWEKHGVAISTVATLLGVVVAVLALLNDRGVFDSAAPVPTSPSPVPPSGGAPSPGPPPCPASAGPALRSSASDDGGRETALLVPRPPAICVGDLMVAQGVVRGPGNVTPPAGWVAVATTTINNESMTTFSRVADAADARTDGPAYSFGTVDSDDVDDNGEAGGITVWSGVDVGATPVVSSSTGTDVVAPVTGVEVGRPGSVIVLMFGPIGPLGVTPPPGMTSVWTVQTPASSGSYLYRASAACAYSVGAPPGATGPRPVHITTESPQPWMAQLLALAPATS